MSLQSFHEVVFPHRLALGLQGGPEALTEIIALAGGGEARNARWATTRRRWDLAGPLTDLDALAELSAFFEARRGRLHGFRFRDPVDDRSGPPSGSPSPTDQVLGQGDGSRAEFQLVKREGDMVRRIVKPVAGSVRVAVDGIERTAGVSVDTTTGVVSFEAAPAAGALVTGGFRFHCPVRFDMDRLDLSLDHPAAGRMVGARLVELVA